MKKSKLVLAPLAIMVSWVTGAIVYFMSVSNYYRKKEKREEDQRSTSSYLSDVARTGVVRKSDAEVFELYVPSPRAIRYPTEPKRWDSGISAREPKWRSYYNPDAKHPTAGND